MKPRGMRSKWVKLRPWYYTKRRQATRADETAMAMQADPSTTHGPDFYDRMTDMYDRLGEVKPPEPIQLTREQWDAVKALVQPSPAPGWDFGGSPSPIFATPIEIVTTVEESTPYLKGWAGWRVVGHPDATLPPSSASVAPQPEETESA